MVLPHINISDILCGVLRLEFTEVGRSQVERKLNQQGLTFNNIKTTLELAKDTKGKLTREFGSKEDSSLKRLNNFKCELFGLYSAETWSLRKENI